MSPLNTATYGLNSKFPASVKNCKVLYEANVAVLKKIYDFFFADKLTVNDL